MYESYQTYIEPVDEVVNQGANFVAEQHVMTIVKVVFASQSVHICCM